MKNILETLLAHQLRRLLNKHRPTIIAVVGSVGKTSTKLAIATVLKKHVRVRYQEGNYNVPLTVPLVFFNQTMPSSLYNIFAWVGILIKNELSVLRTYPYDVVVIEYGIDKPGEMQQLLKLAKPDIGVITAISYEHMANFSSLEEVASEELLIVLYCKRAVFACKDSVKPGYLQEHKSVTWYGTGKCAVTVKQLAITSKGVSAKVSIGKQSAVAQLQLTGKHSLTAAAAAAGVATELGLSIEDTIAGMQDIRAFSGRMNVLRGRQGMTLIDDTYNSSPEAVLKALDTLYEMDGTQKIAVLGSMNELGAFSEESHALVGAYCKPKQLDELVTIGEDAKKFMAPVAEAKGCRVHSFMDPYSAGAYVKSIAYPKAVVLFKGSQNGVFAEEALKPLLLDPKDASKLVRQSAFWQKKKYKQFHI